MRGLCITRLPSQHYKLSRASVYGCEIRTACPTIARYNTASTFSCDSLKMTLGKRHLLLLSMRALPVQRQVPSIAFFKCEETSGLTRTSRQSQSTTLTKICMDGCQCGGLSVVARLALASS